MPTSINLSVNKKGFTTTSFHKRALHSFGFTLVELLVVVSIIALLTTIGMVVFTDAQIKARDARRKLDLSAMAGALEANQALIGYQPLTPSQISGGNFPNQKIISGFTVPTDPKGVEFYCLYETTDEFAASSADPAPTSMGGSTAATACPTSPTGWNFVGYNSASYLHPATGTKKWKICTLLEKTTSGSRNVFCLSSKQ